MLEQRAKDCKPLKKSLSDEARPATVRTRGTPLARKGPAHVVPLMMKDASPVSALQAEAPAAGPVIPEANRPTAIPRPEDSQTNEEFFRLITDLTSDYAYACTIAADGAIHTEFLTEGFTRLTGLTVEDVRARGEWPSIFHPDELPAVAAQMNRLLAGEKVVSEARIITRCGEIRWIRYSAQAVRRADSERVERIVGAVQDISEERKAKEQLRDHAAVLTSVLDSMAEGVIVADREGRFLLYNPAAERIAGVAAMPHDASPDRWAPLYGIRLADGVTPCPPDQVPLARALRGEAVDGVDIFIDHDRIPEGRWLRVSARPLQNRDGTSSGGVVVFRDESERRRADERIREYAEQLRFLSRRLLQVQEEERRHLARELHDEIGQLLTGVKLSLEAVPRASADGVAGALAEAKNQVQNLIAQVRNLSLDLRPSLLDDFGLRATLEWLFERYTTQTGVRVNPTVEDLDCRFAPEVETAAFRIVQEGLTNVARHAGAKVVSVHLWHDSGRLFVQVADEGQGFDPVATRLRSGSTGLSGMQERAALLGGRLVVRSEPGSGTVLTAEIPLPDVAPEQTFSPPDIGS
jgi:PAS domain S-box-containing protein